LPVCIPIEPPVVLRVSVLYRSFPVYSFIFSLLFSPFVPTIAPVFVAFPTVRLLPSKTQ